MSELHIRVLLNEVVDAFSNLSGRQDLIYMDGTYGRGGHFRALLDKYRFAKAYIVDQDLQAVARAKQDWPTEIGAGRFAVFHGNFMEFTEQLKHDVQFDMILLDLGVSSPQLDEGARGFSFNKDGPLDMRMNQAQELTAAKIVNEYDEDELFNVFKAYGEIQNPARVVRAILKDREEKPFVSTLQLAQMIERVDGWHKKGFHPATQYFMALRLVVNRELEVVARVLPMLISKLRDQGRLAVISFHSLEDRLVKNLFKESTDGFAVYKKVIVPSENECKINVRARSAKLRVFQKGLAPEKPDKFALRRAQRIE